MKFEQHGVYEVEVKDQILLVDARGPFNDTTLESYRADVKKAVLHLSASDWGQIIVLRGQSLFTPDAEQILYESTCWRIEHGLNASSVVMIEPDAEELIRAQMSRIYARANLPHHFAADIPAAKQWLKSQIP